MRAVCLILPWILPSLMTLLVCLRADGASSARLKTPSGKSILISAESFYRDADIGVMELTGNVQIVYGDEHLSCDRATVRLLSEEVEASGHILVVSPMARVEGTRAVMNYATETGLIYNGFVESQQIALEGETVRKTGPHTYVAEKATFTACTTCPPAWLFSGSRITAELGGYARIKNPLFKIAYFPLPIWLPYIVVPLKSDRQTGFLAPSIGFEGPGGTSLAEPYFWAISRSQDATLTVKDYQFRGVKALTNYRYALTDSTGGQGNVGILQDQVFVGDTQLTKFKTVGAFNRWFIDYAHSIELPDGFTQKTKISLVSDLFYLRDFPEDIKGYGDPALENRVSLTHNTENTHASVDASYYTNLLERNPVSANADAVQRFPELRYSIAESRIADSGVLFHLDANYANFVRNGLSYDDVAGSPSGVLGTSGRVTPDELARLPNPPIKWVDNSRGPDAYGQGLGQFDPGQDVIRAGQRLDVRPEISAPFHLGQYLDVLPSLAFRHTQYSFAATGDQPGFDSTPARDYTQAQISTRTRISRIYDPPEDDRPIGSTEPPARRNRYKHEIEPEVTFSTIPWSRQSTNPFFGSANAPPPFLNDQPISDDDFYTNRGVQFDYFDRVINRNVLTFGLANKVIRKSWSADDAAYKQIVNLKLTQSYDLDEARRNRYPLSDFATLLEVRMDNFETNTIVRYYPYNGYANTSSRVKVMDTRKGGLKDFIQVSYSQAFLISDKIPNPDAYLQRTENLGIQIGFDSKYVGLTSGIDYLPAAWTPLDLQVKDWVAAINLKPPGNCWGIQFLFQQVIGIGSTYKVDFDYKFGG